MKIYWKLKEEALDRSLWGTRFVSSYALVVKKRRRACDDDDDDDDDCNKDLPGSLQISPS